MNRSLLSKAALLVDCQFPCCLGPSPNYWWFPNSRPYIGRRVAVRPKYEWIVMEAWQTQHFSSGAIRHFKAAWHDRERSISSEPGCDTILFGYQGHKYRHRLRPQRRSRTLVIVDPIWNTCTKRATQHPLSPMAVRQRLVSKYLVNQLVARDTASAYRNVRSKYADQDGDIMVSSRDQTRRRWVHPCRSRPHCFAHPA